MFLDFAVVLEQGLVAVGCDRSERDGVGADAARPVVEGECTGESFDRRLCGGLGQRALHGTLGLVRRDVDDRARTAVREEVSDGGGAAGESEAEVQSDEVEHLAGSGRVKGGVAEDGGVVDPTGERCGCLGRVGRTSGDVLITGVSGHGGDPFALARPSECVSVQVDGDHVTGPCEAFDNCPTDPAGASGYDV